MSRCSSCGGFCQGKSCDRKNILTTKTYTEAKHQKAIDELKYYAAGLRHNIAVADDYLSKIKETECSKDAWDCVENTREFLELEGDSDER